jgi:hypothetical protein
MKKQAHTTTRTGLSMRWVPVLTDGRVRMEMRWSAPPTVSRRTA